MTQSGCAILERKMGGNGGRNLAAQRSKQLFWNQESVPWASILPEFSRIKRTSALLLLHLQTAFTWVCWVHSCQAVWECECHRSHDRARVARQKKIWDLGHLGFHCRLSWICSILSSQSCVPSVSGKWYVVGFHMLTKSIVVALRIIRSAFATGLSIG